MRWRRWLGHACCVFVLLGAGWPAHAPASESPVSLSALDVPVRPVQTSGTHRRPAIVPAPVRPARGAPAGPAPRVAPHGVPGPLVESPHDVTARTASGQRICVVCHTPVATEAAATPRWTRHPERVVFTPYGPPSARQQLAAVASIKACVTCHDDAVGRNVADSTEMRRLLQEEHLLASRHGAVATAQQAVSCPSDVARMPVHGAAAGPGGAVAPGGVVPVSARLGEANVRVPGSISHLCLSCHDGTVGPDALGDVTPAGHGELAGRWRKGHPVQVQYDTRLVARRKGLLDPAGDADGDPNTVGDGFPFLPLQSGRIECSTCHDPHNLVSEDNPKLLIRPIQRSRLCRTCHLK